MQFARLLEDTPPGTPPSRPECSFSRVDPGTPPKATKYLPMVHFGTSLNLRNLHEKFCAINPSARLSDASQNISQHPATPSGPPCKRRQLLSALRKINPTELVSIHLGRNRSYLRAPAHGRSGERPTCGQEAHPSFIFGGTTAVEPPGIAPSASLAPRARRQLSACSEPAFEPRCWPCSRSSVSLLRSGHRSPPTSSPTPRILEEPGNLEIAEKSLTAAPKDANSFLGLHLRIRIWRHRLVDHRALSRGPKHLPRVHHFHRLPLGEPRPSHRPQSPRKSRPLPRIRGHQRRRQKLLEVVGHDVSPTSSLRTPRLAAKSMRS